MHEDARGSPRATEHCPMSDYHDHPVSLVEMFEKRSNTFISGFASCIGLMRLVRERKGGSSARLELLNCTVGVVIFTLTISISDQVHRPKHPESNVSLESFAQHHRLYSFGYSVLKFGPHK